jgi:transposase
MKWHNLIYIPQRFGYTQKLWDGKLLAYHLSARYDVQLGVRQCQRIFRRLGFRRRNRRPLIAKGDPAAQAAY